MCVEQDVKAHNERVQRVRAICYCVACSRCDAQRRFQPHDCRRRSFRIVVGAGVEVIDSWILRWRCRACDSRFTDYPPFALPHKRFVTQDIQGKAKDYACTDASYRKVTRVGPRDIRLIQYTESPKDPAAALAPSTVWRWLAWLGTKPPLERICDLIRQKTPNCAVHRDTSPIHATKYRSPERRVLLQRALRLLVAGDFFEKLFGKNIFPNFATGAAAR